MLFSPNFVRGIRAEQSQQVPVRPADHPLDPSRCHQHLQPCAGARWGLPGAGPLSAMAAAPLPLAAARAGEGPGGGRAGAGRRRRLKAAGPGLGVARGERRWRRGAAPCTVPGMGTARGGSRLPVGLHGEQPRVGVGMGLRVGIWGWGSGAGGTQGDACGSWAVC